MNRLNWIFLVLLAAALAAAVVGWRKSAQARAEMQGLQAEMVLLQQESATTANNATAQRQAELATARSQNQELLRLRSEANQLRSSAKEAEKLRTDNEQLKSELQKLRTNPAPKTSTAESSAKDQFPKESWAFAGYSTPDAALVSAIWAMKEGNPKTYLESLSPEEQLRMSKVWENKTAEEIAAKHQTDVSTITGMRILDRKTISPDEVQMKVFIDGVDRMEKVSMKLVNNEWKFAGFIREPKQP